MAEGEEGFTEPARKSRASGKDRDVKRQKIAPEIETQVVLSFCKQLWGLVGL